MIKPSTIEEILALPALPHALDAAKAMGFGRTKAYELIQDGEFPIEVLRLGGRYRVRRADLLAFLGVEDRPGVAA